MQNIGAYGANYERITPTKEAVFHRHCKVCNNDFDATLTSNSQIQDNDYSAYIGTKTLHQQSGWKLFDSQVDEIRTQKVVLFRAICPNCGNDDYIGAIPSEPIKIELEKWSPAGYL